MFAFKLLHHNSSERGKFTDSSICSEERRLEGVIFVGSNGVLISLYLHMEGLWGRLVLQVQTDALKDTRRGSEGDCQISPLHSSQCPIAKLSIHLILRLFSIIYLVELESAYSDRKFCEGKRWDFPSHGLSWVSIIDLCKVIQFHIQGTEWAVAISLIPIHRAPQQS
jgi:hypothetical protein